MVIELVSFKYNLKANKRLDLMASLVNQSQADLLMFCGNTLLHQDNLDVLKDQVENKTIYVLFEVKQVKESDFLKLNNCLYFIKNGVIHNMFTNQFFSTKKEIEGKESLCERFVYELETRRRFKVKGKNCMVLQCGEINIINNIQKEDNRPVFRLQNRDDLKDRFDSLMNDTHIILNPMHTPMGNQGKMKKRREYFSSNNRYYFSVSQNGILKRKDKHYEISMDSPWLQYAFHDGKTIENNKIETTRDFQKRTFYL